MKFLIFKIFLGSFGLAVIQIGGGCYQREPSSFH